MDQFFQEHERGQAAQRAEQDQRDFNDEMAGRDNGRMARFGVKTAKELEAERAKKDKSRLDELLMNASYRAAYDRAMTALIEAETAVYEAIDQARNDLTNATETIQEMEDNAHILPDGTKVFQAKDGSVYTADGQKIEGEALDSIIWHKNAASYEDYLAQQQVAKEAQDRLNRLMGYDQELRDMRDKMTDPDNPPSRDDLEGIEDRLRTLIPKASINSHGLTPSNSSDSNKEIPTVFPEKVPDLDL